MSEVAPVFHPIRFGVFEVDLANKTLRKSGVRIRLEGQPFQILEMLLVQPGAPVSREELRKRLWASDTFVDFDQSINVAVKRLREALDDSAGTPRYIETLPRVGYRFIYPVEANPRKESAADTVEVHSPALPQSPRFWRRSGRRALFAAVLLLAVAAGSLVVLNLAGLKTLVFGSPEIRSVVVLPFWNHTADPKLENVADAFTDALTTELAEATAWRVTSVTSAMYFKGQRKKTPEIARELDVDSVVEASILDVGEKVRIKVRLIHALTDRYLWTQLYETEFQNLPRLQGRVAREILQAAKVPLQPQEAARMQRGRTLKADAYLAELRGRAEWASASEERALRSIEHFNEAIRIDPQYAEAWSGLARAYTTLRQVDGSQETVQKLREAAERALQLDPGLSEPHALLGNLKRILSDFKGAEEHLRVAIELNPSDAYAHHFLANLHTIAKDHQQARIERKIAEHLDPKNAFLSALAMTTLSGANRDEEAIAQGKKALALDPNMWLAHSGLAGIYRKQGNLQDAIAHYEKARTLPGAYEHWPLSQLIHTYKEAGMEREALKALMDLEEVYKTRYVEPLRMAWVYGLMGQKDNAFRAIEYGIEQGDPMHELYERVEKLLGDDPRFDTVRRYRSARPTASNSENGSR